MYRCLGPSFLGFASPWKGFLWESRTLGSSRFSKAMVVKVGMVANGRILAYLGLAAIEGGGERGNIGGGFKEGERKVKRQMKRDERKSLM